MRLLRLEEARSTAQSALVIYVEIGSSLCEANAWNCLGRLYTQLGQLDEAERALHSALALYSNINNRLEEVNFSNLLGFVYRRLGRINEARAILLSSADISGVEGFALALGTSHRYLGLFHRECGQFVEAKACFEQALRCYEPEIYPKNAKRMLQDLAALRRAGGSSGETDEILSDEPETASLRAGEHTGSSQMRLNFGYQDRGSAFALDSHVCSKDVDLSNHAMFQDSCAVVNLAYSR